MKLKTGHWIILLFTAIYILAYSIYYMSIQNYEFIWYILVMVFFFFLIFFTLDKSKFDLLILWGLSIWGLLHMSGGGLIVNGDVLYNLSIIHLFDVGDTFVLKFDQLVHMFGFFVTAIAAFHVMRPRIKYESRAMIFILAALISMGLGAINEIVEFIATVTIERVNVGGYYNTALDLIFNMIGAFLAIILMKFRE